VVKARRSTKYTNASSTRVNSKRKSLIFLIGTMAFIVSLVVVCAAACPADSSSDQFPVSTDCTFTSHAFVHIGDGQPALFILLLIGLFLTLHKSTISAGFYLSPSRPPRFIAVVKKTFRFGDAFFVTPAYAAILFLERN
jgi:hypothetical protein